MFLMNVVCKRPVPFSSLSSTLRIPNILLRNNISSFRYSLLSSSKLLTFSKLNHTCKQPETINPILYRYVFSFNNNNSTSILNSKHLNINKSSYTIVGIRRSYATHNSYQAESDKARRRLGNDPTNKRRLGPHHIAITVLVMFMLGGSLAYVFKDMIFENSLYNATIDELKLDPTIVKIFGEKFSAKTFHRDHHDEANLNRIKKKTNNYKKNNQNDDQDKKEDETVFVKINFNIYAETDKGGGKGSVRCRAKRISSFKYEIVSLRVKYGIRWIVVIDRDRKPPKKQNFITKVFDMFKNKL
ncbi:hypothetical protein PPL_07370 [Heterostelium album PN500]|uniref:Mitochondrial import inner membrane translocase subunit Tim21 n=1 Tax=Heterostelium pallidum (strain ATCC 26659 / Pp 5 / PN500) TaxID=670386 RepID=D3BFR9_HETP5|nr:hypothetical protein PPL_07370 [Heterostelium album PN500]EFA79679.1 hypothetical protein PPL_07370 [Heterostelium album PN500]|eukprot:XP_020431800.1 hypothetical protein PPL_07370 [Heterostelium album PN500]